MSKQLFRRMSLLLLALMMAGGVALAQTEIVYWTHEDPNRTALEDELILKFEAENPDYKVVRVTNPSDQMGQLILTAFAANRGPDIFNMDIPQEFPYIVNARVTPVDAAAAGYADAQAIYDAYLPGVLDPVTYEGELYGLPLEVTNWAIYLNMNVFRSAGLDPLTDYPKTWEQMMDVAEKLTIRDGDIITRRGFDFRYPYYLNFMVPMAEQLGGKLISDDGKSAIVNDAAWLRVLEYFQQWGPNGKNLGSPTYTAARKIFNLDNNDIGMMESGQYQAARIMHDNPGFEPGKGWMVIPFPQWEDAVADVAEPYYGHYWLVNAQASKEKQAGAWAFLGFLSHHAADFFEQVAILQPTQSLVNSDLFKDSPYSDVFMSDLAKAHVIYYGEDSPKVQQVLKDAVEAVMLQGKDPADVLKTMREGVERAMRGEL
ncbi:MAG TPA: extracellular solute-binding protein [Trueperaceae bacterium]|nr:extracellular solute-binding protein [Trueperaceae bacterium]